MSNTQTFKLNAESIRVIATSDLPVEIRQQPVLPTASSALSTSYSNRQNTDRDTDPDPCALFNIVHVTGESHPSTQSQSTAPPSQETLDNFSMEIWSKSDEEQPSDKESDAKKKKKH
jgi:hypothetical protein